MYICICIYIQEFAKKKAIFVGTVQIKNLQVFLDAL